MFITVKFINKPTIYWNLYYNLIKKINLNFNLKNNNNNKF